MHERVGISLVEAYESVGNLSKDLKGLTDAFYACEKVEKTFWFGNIFIFKQR